MFKKILATFSLLLLVSYQHFEDHNKWVINLQQEKNDSLNLNFVYVKTHLISLDRVPIFKEHVLKNYTGIPENDSIAYYGNFEETLQFFYDLYKNKQYDKSEFIELVKKIHVDTLRFSKKPLKQGFISIVGFYKNKQFIIADFNRNQNFGDDFKYEFDINFRKKTISENLELINKLPYSEYKYETYSKGKIQNYKRKITLFPSASPYDRKIMVSNKEREYFSFFRFKDYWKGEQLINNSPYEFYYQALDNTFGALYIKPKLLNFRKDEVFNQQYLHYTEDTIAIDDGYYKIDSINREISKLFLRKISSNNQKYGQEVGSYFKNLVIEDLGSDKFRTDSIIKKKEYTLIDFWGTWCGPCLDMTPKLLKIQNKFSSKLSIISIANDKNKNAVKLYVNKNKMNWVHGFADMRKDPDIYKNLSIQVFPTFILLNSDGKILLRGGSEVFDKLEILIK